MLSEMQLRCDSPSFEAWWVVGLDLQTNQMDAAAPLVIPEAGRRHNARPESVLSMYRRPGELLAWPKGCRPGELQKRNPTCPKNWNHVLNKQSKHHVAPLSPFERHSSAVFSISPPRWSS